MAQTQSMKEGYVGSGVVCVRQEDENYEEIRTPKYPAPHGRNRIVAKPHSSYDGYVDVLDTTEQPISNTADTYESPIELPVRDYENVPNTNISHDRSPEVQRYTTNSIGKQTSTEEMHRRHPPTVTCQRKVVIAIIITSIILVIGLISGMFFIGQSAGLGRIKSTPSSARKIQNQISDQSRNATASSKDSQNTIPQNINFTTYETTSLSTYLDSPYPECSEATNLTEPWRRWTNGTDTRPGGDNSEQGYACDLRANLKWFRLAGAAGTRLLDKCPQYASCGTAHPLWTEDPIPDALGAKVTIHVYSRHHGEGNCKGAVWRAEVLRCNNYDVIYRYLDEYYETCWVAFCGMRA